jgi:leucyl aminopeptidase
LGLLVAEGQSAFGLWAAADEATGGAVSRAFEAAEFTGKDGQSVTILAPGAGLSRIVAAGLGKPADITARKVEEASGSLAAALMREKVAAVAADGVEHPAAAAMGAVLRAYRFDLYRTKQKPEDLPKLTALTVLTKVPEEAAPAWEKLRAVAHGVFFTRDLVSEPANILHPVEMATRIQTLSSLGLDIEVFGQAELEALGFGSLLCVSVGSAQPPRMVVMRWNGAGDDSKPVAFIGKGVTFDTGGISIKPAMSHFMSSMPPARWWG